MSLMIDIGNTKTKYAYFVEERIKEKELAERKIYQKL